MSSPVFGGYDPCEFVVAVSIPTAQYLVLGALNCVLLVSCQEQPVPFVMWRVLVFGCLFLFFFWGGGMLVFLVWFGFFKLVAA